jgi:hypothetical protein
VARPFNDLLIFFGRESAHDVIAPRRARPRLDGVLCALTFDPRFFAELRTCMSPEAQAKIEADAQRLGEEWTSQRCAVR